jgi:hypothetical protein
VVGSGVDDDPPWLATAYVPGPPLATVVAKYGPLPEPAIWKLAAGVAEALRAVHAAGLVHRDLKPANVLLADDGPHVIDFGISRAFAGTQLTSAGMVIGTPGYMSPEQAKTGPVGPASDIFSLGCVLACAAAGSPPFEGENAASVLYQIVSTEPDLSAIPPRLRQVVEACLKKDPAQRPAPAQVIAMINALGPETPATLGSFWPASVGRVIAAEKSSQTPAGLTPPGPLSAPYTGQVESGATAGAGAGRMSGSTGMASPAPAERTPTARAAPAPGQGGSPTGHAPMLSDGYYAAAASRSAPNLAPPGPTIAPPSPPPQSYAGPQPYVMQQPGGQAPPGQPSAGQAAFGPAGYGPSAFGQPGLGAPSPYPGQAPFYPGQQPNSAGPQYAMGRRKPMSAEVPPTVHTAIKLMYAGFVVTLLDAVLSMTAFGQYDNQVGVANAAGRTAAADNANSMSGAVAVGMIADFLGLVCWIWLAMACRRGSGWTRIAGTVLLGIYSLCALFVLFGTRHDLGPQFTTVVVWGIGVAAVISLWSQQAREFFYAWRRR